MKKVLYGLALAVVLMGPLAFLHAEDGASSTKPIRKAEEVRDRIEERRSLFNEKRDDLKGKFEEKRGEIREIRRENIDALIDRTIARFEQAIKRLQNIHARILARVEVIEKNRDIDLTETRQHLGDATESIKKAADTLADVPDAVDEILGTTTATTTPGAFGPIRDLFGTVKEHIKNAHASLVKAVVSIKGLGPIREKTSTSTDSE